MDFSTWIMQAGLPVVGLYHAFCVNPFFNVSAEDATGLEKMANVLLTPSQYLFVGKTAFPNEEGYEMQERFNYKDGALWWKTFAAYSVLPPSLLLGSLLKGVSYLSSETRVRSDKISLSLSRGGCSFETNNPYYRLVGIDLLPVEKAERMVSQGHARRPADLDNLKIEKQALKEIIGLLEAHDIVYWLDCGTCLGAYRYGGIIPWDWDMDLAILQPDFANVRHALSSLDPNKYVVQDWSSRDKPQTYLKVYVKESGSLIDIYHFAIDPIKKEIRSILSNEGSIFLPESWKIRERRYLIPTPFSYVFPLKRVSFDGIEAYVPNQTEKYLQQRYGQNIGPVKVYNPLTQEYEKDLTHPYWKDLYAR